MKTIISHVVALSNNRVIGKDNDLPWNLKTDLKHFREYTTNKILIMGRKTFESIGRPLPNRTNIIVSKTIQYKFLVQVSFVCILLRVERFYFDNK